MIKIKTKVLPVLCASVLSVCVNTAPFSLTAYASVTESPIGIEEGVTAQEEERQNTEEPEITGSFEEQDKTKEETSGSAEKTDTTGSDTAEVTTEYVPDGHHLAFASDYHNTEGSIHNALSGMPENVEYVGMIGDMVGDRFRSDLRRDE